MMSHTSKCELVAEVRARYTLGLNLCFTRGVPNRFGAMVLRHGAGRAQRERKYVLVPGYGHLRANGLESLSQILTPTAPRPATVLLVPQSIVLPRNSLTRAVGRSSGGAHGTLV